MGSGQSVVGLVAGCMRALEGELGLSWTERKACTKSKSVTWHRLTKCGWARGSPCAQVSRGELWFV